MTHFDEIIKTINRMPEALAAEQYEQMKTDPEAVEKSVLNWANGGKTVGQIGYESEVRNIH